MTMTRTMTILKLLRQPFSFGGACPTQLFALTPENHYVYGRLRHGTFRLEMSKYPMRLNIDKVKHLRLSDEWSEDTEMITIFESSEPELDGLCNWKEFVEVCSNNGVDIQFYNVVDYMKSQKKGND